MNEKHMTNPIFCLLAEQLTPVPPRARSELRERVLAVCKPAPGQLIHLNDGEFEPFLPGIQIKTLRRDQQTETTLWRLAPGAVIPGHGHNAEEECMVIAGDIHYAGQTLGVGDYLRAIPGEVQSSIFSQNGALLLIRAELRPSLTRP